VGCSWLFLVKFRHKVKKVFLGWTLGMEAALIAHGLSDGTDKKKADMGPFMPSHLRSLGRLGNSMYVRRCLMHSYAPPHGLCGLSD
jgi:hypothetical protein